MELLSDYEEALAKSFRASPEQEQGTPQVGTVVGKGNFSVVYAHPTNPALVIKRTTCDATIALLRALRNVPQTGLPSVQAELHQELCGAAWFCLERLYTVSGNDLDVAYVFEAVHDTYEVVHCEGRDDVTESEIAAHLAVELTEQGFVELASAAEYLSAFLDGRMQGVLDIRTPNILRNVRGELVLADPVCPY